MAQILSPSYLVDYINDAALSKSRLKEQRLLVMSVLGGIYISLGGLLAMVVAGGATSLLVTNPGLDKLLFGALFPIGFIARARASRAASRRMTWRPSRAR